MTFKQLLSFIIFILLFNAHSQELSGIATYQIRYVGTNVETEDSYQKFVQGLIPTIEELQYELRFSNSKSMYGPIETMYLDRAKEIEPALILAGKGTYYNSIGNSTIMQRSFSGDNFLISLDGNKIEWNISKESKKIEQYNCLKATAKIEMNNGKVKNIIAWFTTEISAPFGPKQYNGLPGLILHLEEGELLYYCTSIELGNYPFSIPKKGIKMTQEEFDGYVNKKAQELFGTKN